MEDIKYKKIKRKVMAIELLNEDISLITDLMSECDQKYNMSLQRANILIKSFREDLIAMLKD